MYDFKLKNNEEIRLISDDTIIYTDNEEINVTCIITIIRIIIPVCFICWWDHIAFKINICGVRILI